MGTGCAPWSCSHIQCRLETHNCTNASRTAVLDISVPELQHSCHNGSSHHSIRVFHSRCGAGAPSFGKGCEETVCHSGHHCGMGFLTGDTTQCECRPDLPQHHFLPCKHTRAEHRPLLHRHADGNHEWSDACLDK